MFTHESPARLTLGTLMGAVLIVTLGLAAFRSLSALWVSGTFTAAVVVLSAAAVGALVARGRSRASWTGMAVFGWVYLGWAFGPWPHNIAGPPPLLTVSLLEAAQDYLVSDGRTPYLTLNHRPPRAEDVLGTSRNMGPGPAPPGGYKTVNVSDYTRVGHSLGALLFALAGAFVGRALAGGGEAAG